MYSVTVRDHIMIAHSLPHDFFGPAAAMHGATYIVDAQFYSNHLDEHNVVIDIGLAQNELKTILSKLNYQNLDEIEEFKGKLTTTEFIARYIHDQFAIRLRQSFSGDLNVSLKESHVAAASYKGPITG